MDQDRKLLPNVAARRLEVTDQHVRRLYRQGKLPGENPPGKRDLRIPESAVEAYRQQMRGRVPVSMAAKILSDDKKLLPNVAARRLGVTDTYVRRLVRQGKLPGEKSPNKRALRIPEAAVEAYRQENDMRDKVPVNVAAKIIGKSPETVRRWARDGKIECKRPSSRKILILKSAIEAYRQEHE